MLLDFLYIYIYIHISFYIYTRWTFVYLIWYLFTCVVCVKILKAYASWEVQTLTLHLPFKMLSWSTESQIPWVLFWALFWREIYKYFNGKLRGLELNHVYLIFHNSKFLFSFCAYPIAADIVVKGLFTLLNISDSSFKIARLVLKTEWSLCCPFISHMPYAVYMFQLMHAG